MTRRFDRGHDYPEREMNAILADDLPDHATLGRLLVGESFLDRAAGVCRRR